jgi:hypothetical protein
MPIWYTVPVASEAETAKCVPTTDVLTRGYEGLRSLCNEGAGCIGRMPLIAARNCREFHSGGAAAAESDLFCSF